MKKTSIIQYALFINMMGFSIFASAKLFHTKDQEAYGLFGENKFEEAAVLFEDLKWKSASFIKSGQYDKAIKILKKYKDVDSIYNLGNVFAYNGQFDEAIQSYEKALIIDPNHKDAKYNLEIVKKLKEQNKNSSQNNQNSENKEQNKHSEQNEKKSLNENENQNEDQKENKSQDSKQNSVLDRKEPENKNTSKKDISKESSQETKRDNVNGNKNQKNNSSSLEQEMLKDIQNKKENVKYDENKQALDQWINKIPDDPGGLLKQKFLRDYLRRQTP